MAQKNWVIEMQNEVDETSETSISAQDERWKRRSIYQLHPSITSLNEEAFKPKLVSFGPYHHEEEHLKPMEEHKRRALKHFVKRSTKPFQTFMDSLSQVVDELKNSYDPLAPEWQENNDRFLKMMILDGCFMLEILRVATDILDDYTENDPVFSKHGKLYIILLLRRDMLMIENQLPILVLDTLFTAGGKVEGEESAEKLIAKFLWPHPDQSSKLQQKCLHVLDVCRKSFVLNGPSHPQEQPPVKKISNNIIHSATTLTEAGIVLKKSSTSSLRDVTFSGGVLRLPWMTVDDTTESTFLNLLAFERFQVGAGNEVTSYIFFMDSIIDTEHDVALLISKGIICNAFGSNKAVADLFNSLSKDTTAGHKGELAQVHQNVNAYCEKRWNAWRANLIHTYFHSPWAMLSLIAAIFLFVLTIVQTVYTVYPYYSPHRN